MPVQDSATTYIGLINDNEFFSAHYLAEVFHGDFAATISEWEGQEQPAGNAEGVGEARPAYLSPYRRLRNLNQGYFALRHRMKTERSAAQRINLQREFFVVFGW